MDRTHGENPYYQKQMNDAYNQRERQQMSERMVYQTHLSLSQEDRLKEEKVLINIPSMTKISVYRLGLEECLKLIKKGA